MYRLNKIFKAIRHTHIITVCFILFSFYVASAAFPQFLVTVGEASKSHTPFDSFIENVDEQYAGMLGNEIDLPLLTSKGTYINLNGYMAQLLGQTSMNGRYKLNNGHLTADAPSLRTQDLEDVFQNITALNNRANADGKSFLFVLAPSQVCPGEDLLPVGFTDTTNDQVSYLFELMDASEIPYLDLRQSMQEDKIDSTQAFFITDHHWRPETGFWAYTKIISRLAQDEHIAPQNTFYLDRANYNFTVYDDSFLGSSGKRTGVYFAGVDDFCVISPNYETNIQVIIPSKGFDFQGRWEDVSYQGGDPGLYLAEPDYFNDNPYGRYGWSDRPLTQWRNINAPEHKKIMLIGDSFGNVPFSLMSLYFSSCDELDMRHFEGDFTAHYEEANPDIIVLLVNINSILTPNTQFPYFQ